MTVLILVRSWARYRGATKARRRTQVYQVPAAPCCFPSDSSSSLHTTLVSSSRRLNLTLRGVKRSEPHGELVSEAGALPETRERVGEAGRPAPLPEMRAAQHRAPGLLPRKARTRCLGCAAAGKGCAEGPVVTNAESAVTEHRALSSVHIPCSARQLTNQIQSMGFSSSQPSGTAPVGRVWDSMSHPHHLPLGGGCSVNA